MKRTILEDIQHKLDGLIESMAEVKAHAIKTDKRLEAIEAIKPVSQDEFMGLFRYMTARFDKIERELDKKADKELMLTKLDGIIARLDADHVERTMLSNQVDRHEGWINQLAKKTNTKLSKA